MKYYFLEIPLLYKCNQKCDYCNVWKMNSTILEIDLDYLSWCLNEYPDNLLIELTGGEPGLLSENCIYKIIKELRSHNHVKKIQLNSNGLIRVKYPDLIKEVDYYNEHLVYELNGKEINKFYDVEIFPDKYSNLTSIIVLTKNTVTSLIEYTDYYEKLGIIGDKAYLKVMNFKSNHLLLQEDLNALYESLKGHTKNGNIDSTFCNTQTLCSLFSHSPALNLFEKKILHCSINYDLTEKASISKVNIKKHVHGKLFSKAKKEYCNKCNTPMCYVYSVFKDSLNNKFWNRIV